MGPQQIKRGEVLHLGNLLEALVSDFGAAQVKAGELLVLLGGSGSGKTTTLKMINRLIEPNAGSVRLNGTDISSLPPHDYGAGSATPFSKWACFRT